MRKTIRFRLTVAFIVLGVCPLVLMAAVLAWRALVREREHAMAVQQEVAERVSVEVSSFLAELADDLRVSAIICGARHRELGELEDILGALQVHQKAFLQLALLDTAGREKVRVSRVQTAIATPMRDRSSQDVFRVPLRTADVYYGPIRLDPVNGEPLMSISSPLLDLRTGDVVSVLVADIRLKRIWNLIAGLQRRPGESTYVVDADGRVIAHLNPSIVLRGTKYAIPRSDGFCKGLSGRDAAVAVRYVQLGDQKLAIIAERRTSEALAVATRTMWITVLGAALVFLASSVTGAVMVRTIVRPVQALAKAARTIASGKLETTVDVTSGDEIGELADAFNIMTRQLADSLETLEREVAERTEAEAGLRKANEQLRQAQSELVQSEKLSMLGQLVAGVAHEINTPTGAIMNVSADSVEHLKQLAAAAMDVQSLACDVRQWLIETIPRALAHGTVVSSFRDRHSHREIERELRRQRVVEYQRIAKVMSAFGLNASDPLAVRCLSEEPVRAFLEHLMSLKAFSEICQASVLKIAKIVRALRYYSRSGEGEVFDINVNESIDNTLVILQNRIKHLAAVKKDYQDPLPAVRCGSDISQVWTNIISNACDAIEDLGRQERGLLRIVTRATGTDLTVEIFNEGPPIPEDIIPKIFDPFFTTKPIGKGTGLGLSICAGILRKYDGRIEVRNEAGGVTFRVSLVARCETGSAVGQAAGQCAELAARD